ncbi:MAG TPA: chemotaxis protein CheW [Chloroflexota bacterium]|nr:chemotaxis protein CheW [Chloroflexota bacterium]
MTAPSGVDELPVVCFELAGESYAADIGHVREIIRRQDIAPIPRAPDFVEGMTNLRGRVLPVVDLRRLLGFPPGEITRRSRILIVEFGGQLLGAIVDAVTQVVRLPSSSLEPPSRVVSRVETAYMRGVAALGESLVVVLDVDRVLTAAQSKALATLDPQLPPP